MIAERVGVAYDRRLNDNPRLHRTLEPVALGVCAVVTAIFSYLACASVWEAGFQDPGLRGKNWIYFATLALFVTIPFAQRVYQHRIR